MEEEVKEGIFSNRGGREVNRGIRGRGKEVT